MVKRKEKALLVASSLVVELEELGEVGQEAEAHSPFQGQTWP